MDFVPFLREFGLPLTMLVIGGFLVESERFVTGKSSNAKVEALRKSKDEEIATLKLAHEAQMKTAEAEKAYREERRVEERSNRLLTEEALRNQVSVMRDMTELLKDIERNLTIRSTK